MTVLGGGAIVLATWFTGVGDGVGAAVIAAGGSIYTTSTAVSEIGNGIKWLSGQSGGVTAAQALSIPLMRLGPVGRIVADKAVSHFVNEAGLGDPCDG
jgi:hypothetical protein